MSTAPTSPQPRPGEPHPAVRLAEVVCALLAAIAGPSWLWRFLPGGRAFWAQMQQRGHDFAALMHRLAAGIPPETPAPHDTSTPRAPRLTIARRPDSARRSATARPRRAQTAPAHAATPLRATVPAPPSHQPFTPQPEPQPEPPWPRPIGAFGADAGACPFCYDIELNKYFL